MTATTEHILNQTAIPEEQASLGWEIRKQVHKHLPAGLGRNVNKIIWDDQHKLRWEVTFPENSSEETLDTFALTAMLGVFNQSAHAVREKIKNEQPLSVALEPRFLYDSLRAYSQAAKSRNGSLASLMEPLEQSRGTIIDTHLARLVLPYIEKPQIHSVRRGQLLELRKFWPAIKGVHSIMYGRQMAERAAASNGHNGV